jgi:electron transfer DM13
VTNARSRHRSVELVPQALLAVATFGFVVTKLNAVRSAAGSVRALALLAAIGVAWLAFSLLLMPWLVRTQWARVAISGVVALALAWVLFANAYHDTKVVERLAGLQPRTEQVTLDAEASTPSAVAPVPAPTAPVRLRSAALRGINHRASGTASIIRQTDGSYVVGLEDIDIEPGPDYRVFVVPGNVTRPGDGAVELDKLRGNVGTQFYDVPRDVDPTDGQWTVLVWCRVFAVPIAAAVPA